MVFWIWLSSLPVCHELSQVFLPLISVFFISAWRIFNISFKAGLVVVNSLSNWLGKHLFLPLIWKIPLSDKVFLVGNFYLSTLDISFHSLLTLEFLLILQYLLFFFFFCRIFSFASEAKLRERYWGESDSLIIAYPYEGAVVLLFLEDVQKGKFKPLNKGYDYRWIRKFSVRN